MKIRKILIVVIILAIAASSFGAEPDPLELDPQKQEDRAVLIQMVKLSTSGKGNQAAMRLAKAGQMEDLLRMLQTTTCYNTLQAIAQTQDERTIPIFEERLRRDPDNCYLVGSLAYVQNPKASPILIEVLKLHPDSDKPSTHDMVGCLLNAIVFNRCQDAIPILRQRFAACEMSSQANRKSDYALTLLSLSDPSGMPWVKKRLAEDIESKGPSWTAERLATICDWNRPPPGIVHMRDEAILTPLLPELVRSASSSDCLFAYECVRVLWALTRHDFPKGDARWQEWYRDHAERHPVYSRLLDRSVELCIGTFRKQITEAGKTDADLKWVDYFLSQPRNLWDGHNDYLWQIHSRPEHALGMPAEVGLPPHEKRKDYGLTFVIGLTSRMKEPDHLIMRRDFSSINLTVCFASPTGNKHISDALTDMAKEACAVLAKYESSYKNGVNAERENRSIPPDPASPRP